MCFLLLQGQNAGTHFYLALCLWLYQHYCNNVAKCNEQGVIRVLAKSHANTIALQ